MDVHTMSSNDCHDTAKKSCCHADKPQPELQKKARSSCCPDENKTGKRRIDWLLWGSLTIVSLFYVLHWAIPDNLDKSPAIATFSASTFELMNKMWWGIALGIVTVGLLSVVPREFVMSALGKNNNTRGIARATAAGVMLDLCSHGILMVAMKLYERGASLGQVMAFLIASPWNSFSLTFILISLIGWQWTLSFVALSMVIAFVSGMLFERLVARGTLPSNPNRIDMPDDFHFFAQAKTQIKSSHFSSTLLLTLITNGIRDSRMVLRWTLFGVVLASLIRMGTSPDMFHDLFGPTLAGLALTLVAATIIEVCSEGSAPIASDLLTRASAPGNSFAFLMTGVSTDYTEIMSLKDTTRSWKVALFLPLITLPQVIILSLIMNMI